MPMASEPSICPRLTGIYRFADIMSIPQFQYLDLSGISVNFHFRDLGFETITSGNITLTGAKINRVVLGL